MCSYLKKKSKKAHCQGYIRSWLQCLAGYLNGEIVLADKGDASSSTSAPPCKSKKWTVNQLYRYGRPLWASFMDSMMAEGKGNLQVLSKVEQFAATKLCGGDVQNFLQIRNGKHLKSPTAIAILGARLVLDVQPHSKLAVDLVADHLSYVLHISSDRTALVTCEAWDPVITAAAATLFEANRFRHAALRKLSKAVQKSWVGEGKNEEIIARYVLMRAADIVRAKNPTVDLESFLDVLCGDIGSTEVKTSTKHQFTGDKEKEQVKEKARLARGWLNFKGFHFVVGYTPTVTNLLEFYKLEKAIICKCNQVKYDIILPVLLPSTKGKYSLEPKRMSAVLVQVKSINGKVKLHYEATTGMNPLGVIGDWKRKQPFASVLMQLGATENCHADFLSVKRPATRSSGPYGMHMPFIVYGLKSMYSFLSEKEREQLSDMIHCRRHPMLNPNTVNFAKSIMPLAFEH